MSEAEENVSISAESKNRIKVLIISGPTGVGKSALAEHLAKHHGPAELISADSVQVRNSKHTGFGGVCDTNQIAPSFR